jgi:hypothetical protein
LGGAGTDGHAHGCRALLAVLTFATFFRYCYGGCVVDWFMNNTEKYNLNAYAGVVGVDHYWTHQGESRGEVFVLLSFSDSFERSFLM